LDTGELWNTISSTWNYIQNNTILFDLTLTAIVLVVLYAVVKTSHKVFSGLYKRGVMTEKAAERVSRTIDLISYILALIAILYIFTQAEQLSILVIALIVLSIIVSWDVLVNLVGYYTLMISRVLEIGSYVEVAGVTGRVREVNLLHTVLETSNGINRVPNKEFLRKTYMVYGETINVCVKIRLDHKGDPSNLSGMEKQLVSLLEARKGEFLAVPEEKIRLTPLKITREYGEYIMKTRMQGPRYDPHRIGQLVRIVTTSMITAGLNGEVEAVKCP
jgi:hypothetical protein